MHADSPCSMRQMPNNGLFQQVNLSQKVYMMLPLNIWSGCSIKGVTMMYLQYQNIEHECFMQRVSYLVLSRCRRFLCLTSI